MGGRQEQIGTTEALGGTAPAFGFPESLLTVWERLRKGKPPEYLSACVPKMCVRLRQAFLVVTDLFRISDFSPSRGALPWIVDHSSKTLVLPACWQRAWPRPCTHRRPSAGAWLPAFRSRWTPSSARPKFSPNRSRPCPAASSKYPCTL